MSSKDIYEITVTNFERHNPNRKKGYRYVWISERFFDDPKIMALKPSDRLLFLSCILVVSQSYPRCAQVSTKLLSSYAGVKPNLIPSRLQTLQSLQLLTFQKTTSFLERNRIERKKNRKEEKRETTSPQKEPPKTEPEQQELLAPDGAPPTSRSGPDVLFELWNKFRGKLPEARGFSASRRKSATLRWREKPSVEYWTEVIETIAASEFCNGQSKTGWRASFDWLLKPETHLRVMEGKYDNPDAALNPLAELIKSEFSQIIQGELPTRMKKNLNAIANAFSNEETWTREFTAILQSEISKELMKKNRNDWVLYLANRTMKAANL